MQDAATPESRGSERERAAHETHGHASTEPCDGTSKNVPSGNRVVECGVHLR
jgi:hypothetical protein